MAYENLCMYCFEEKGSRPVCPHCGRDARAAVPAIQLVPGTLLHGGRFLVGRARGQDANGIVYTAYDTRKNVPLRIREYLPRESARRQSDGSVSPAAGSEESFAAGMEHLRRSVEGVEDPRKRHFFFEENGTGYIAERHSAGGGAAAADGGDEGGGRSIRQIILIVGIAVVVVLGVALAVIHLMNRAVDDPITPVTTLAPETTMWIPAASPTPTPYVGTTIGPIRDPDLSWLDYVYPGDVDAEYDATNPTARPTPTPTVPPAQVTPQPTTTRVTDDSNREQIQQLQNILVRTGWLDADRVTGVYDNATLQAVRDFQRYMNETYDIDPKLAVDGQAGPKTLYWLYQYNLSTKPTPTPTAPPRVTAKPGIYDVVDEKAQPARIKSVQQQLIVLDLLPEGAADGVYGTATREAVQHFQHVVNRLQARTVLSESGVCDADTLAYLEYYADWWPANKPTPTPTPSPTPRPTPTPTATPEPQESNIVVDRDSDPASIRYVQSMLAGLRLLDRDGVDGKFGNGTTQAIRTFQSRVNQLQGTQVLQVTGECDAMTLQYMEYYYEQYVGTTAPTPEPEATPTPTPEITEAPETPAPGETPEPVESEISVGADSDPESIRYVQSMLVQLGLMDASGVDGSFGNGTVRAVRAFQERVNELNDSDLVRTDGVCDAPTLQYLEYYSAQMSQQTPAPEATPLPEVPVEPVETPVPVEPTAAPAAKPAVIDANSDIEDIRDLQSMLADLGLLNAAGVDGSFGNGTAQAILNFQTRVNELQGDVVLDESGVCDADTLQYLRYYADEVRSQAGQTQQETPDETPTEAPAATPEAQAENAAVVDRDSSADSIRQLQQMLADVGLIDAGSVDGVFGDGTTQALRNFQARVNELRGSEVLAVTGVCDAETMEYLEYYSAEMRRRNGEANTPVDVTEGEEEPQSEESQVSVGPNSDPESIRYVQSMLAALGMMDESGVDGSFGNGTTRAIEAFQLRVNQLNNSDVVRTDGVCDAETLQYLEYYYDTVQASTNNAPSESEPEAEPEPTPAVVGTVSAPNISLSNVIATDGGVRYVNGNCTITWNAEGDVGTYYVYIADSNGKEYVNRTSDTNSIDIPGNRMTPGRVYTARIGAIPVNGDTSDVKWSSIQFSLAAQGGSEPAQEEDTSYMPSTISASSDSTAIEKMQRALYNGGWLTSGTAGEFDYSTRQAVAEFQAYMNETYADDPEYTVLTVIDPGDSDSVVDSRTLNMIMHGYR